MSVMCDRGISVASVYTNESDMCDRGISVASTYTNESVMCDRDGRDNPI